MSGILAQHGSDVKSNVGSPGSLCCSVVIDDIITSWGVHAESAGQGRPSSQTHHAVSRAAPTACRNGQHGRAQFPEPPWDANRISSLQTCTKQTKPVWLKFCIVFICRNPSQQSSPAGTFCHANVSLKEVEFYLSWGVRSMNLLDDFTPCDFFLLTFDS